MRLPRSEVLCLTGSLSSIFVQLCHDLQMHCQTIKLREAFITDCCTHVVLLCMLHSIALLVDLLSVHTEHNNAIEQCYVGFVIQPLILLSVTNAYA